MPHHWRPLAHEQNSIFKCKQHTCILHDPWRPEKYDYTISVPTIIALLLSSKPFDLYEVLFLRLFEKVWVLYDFRYMAIQFLLSILEWKGVYFEVFLSLDHEYLKADIMFVSCYIIRNVLCSSWLIINDRCSHSDGLQERYHVRYGDDSVILVRVYMFLEFSRC